MTEHHRRKAARRMLAKHGYKTGGHLHAKSDEAEDKAMIKKAIDEHDEQLHGGKKTHLKLKHGGLAAGMKPRTRKDRPARMPKVSIKIVHPANGSMGMPMGAPTPATAGAPMPPGVMKRGGHVKKHKHGGRTKKRDMGGPVEGYQAGGMPPPMGGQGAPPPMMGGMGGAMGGQLAQRLQQAQAMRALQGMAAQQRMNPGMMPRPGMGPAMAKKGGKVHKRMAGGKVPLTAGSGGGEGRLEKAKAARAMKGRKSD